MSFTDLFAKHLREEMSADEFSEAVSLHKSPEKAAVWAGNYYVRVRTIRALVRASACHDAPKTWGDRKARAGTTIVQYWDDGTPPDAVRNLQATWQRSNPKTPYKLFDAEEATAFVERHYSGREVDAFCYCRHPVLKSDLFRFFYTFAIGGVYADSDEECLKGISHFFAPDNCIAISPRVWHLGDRKELTIGSALSNNISATVASYYVNNAPLFSAAQHPVISYALDYAIEKITTGMNSGISYKTVDLTYPVIFTECFVKHIYSQNIYSGHIENIMIINDWYENYSIEHWLSYKATSAHWGNE